MNRMQFVPLPGVHLGDLLEAPAGPGVYTDHFVDFEAATVRDFYPAFNSGTDRLEWGLPYMPFSPDLQWTAHCQTSATGAPIDIWATSAVGTGAGAAVASIPSSECRVLRWASTTTRLAYVDDGARVQLATITAGGPQSPMAIPGTYVPPYTLMFSPGDHWLAGMDNSNIWVSDVSSATASNALQVSVAPPDGGSSYVSYASFAPTSQLFAYATADAVYFVNLEGATPSSARQLNLDKNKAPLPVFASSSARWSADSAWIGYLGAASAAYGRELDIVNALDAGGVGRRRSSQFSPSCDTSSCTDVVLDFAFQP